MDFPKSDASPMTKPLDIAVIGAGISGLGAAWLLSRKHNVTLIEKEARLGGHSNTVDAPGPAGAVPVDTGFIVFNPETYPNLVALFEHLSVPTSPTLMGFAVSLDRGAYEYSGTTALGMFGQASNIANPRHYRMIADILRFFREAPKVLEASNPDRRTLGEYLKGERYSDVFVTRHVLPMAAAIWSTPTAQVLNFPVASFVRFYSSHGLLRATNRPEWRTVTGGSREYVKRIMASYRAGVETASAALGVRRTPDGVRIRTEAQGDERRFDAVVLACHADEALSLLGDADAHERALLGAFGYSPNRAVLHTDASFMPRRRRVWSSWNYLGSKNESGEDLAVTYWMNALQPLGAAKDYFVTLNPQRPIAPGHFIQSFDYTHPQFDDAALSAQRRLWSLQGRRRTWFCGSYFGYGFHEDGLQSGLAAAELLGGVRRPWTVANESGRLTFGDGSRDGLANTILGRVA